MLPKIMESAHTGARKIFFDRQFLSLANTELRSSLSKTTMINRVRKFLPQLRPSAFTQRGTAGIRSSVVDKTGRFVPDTFVLERDSSLHVLNYNSPGATGALPMAANITTKIIKADVLQMSDKPRSLWDATTIADRMKA
jgi:L-2-hydroxyglutarate oxidase